MWIEVATYRGHCCGCRGVYSVHLGIHWRDKARCGRGCSSFHPAEIVILVGMLVVIHPFLPVTHLITLHNCTAALAIREAFRSP